MTLIASDWTKKRLEEAERNLKAGVFDPLNTILAEMAEIGSKRKLRKSQKRAIKKLATKANKELT